MLTIGFKVWITERKKNVEIHQYFWVAKNWIRFYFHASRHHRRKVFGTPMLWYQIHWKMLKRCFFKEEKSERSKEGSFASRVQETWIWFVKVADEVWNVFRKQGRLDVVGWILEWGCWWLLAVERARKDPFWRMA